MLQLDRRYDARFPLEMYLNAYVEDRPQRGFTVNLSESGLYLNTLAAPLAPPGTAVALEFTLPGASETIWAAGEMCRLVVDRYFQGRAIRFVAMAGLHASLLHHYLRYARQRRLWRQES